MITEVNYDGVRIDSYEKVNNDGAKEVIFSYKQKITVKHRYSHDFDYSCVNNFLFTFNICRANQKLDSCEMCFLREDGSVNGSAVFVNLKDFSEYAELFICMQYNFNYIINADNDYFASIGVSDICSLDQGIFDTYMPNLTQHGIIPFGESSMLYNTDLAIG